MSLKIWQIGANKGTHKINHLSVENDAFKCSTYSTKCSLSRRVHHLPTEEYATVICTGRY